MATWAPGDFRDPDSCDSPAGPHSVLGQSVELLAVLVGPEAAEGYRRLAAADRAVPLAEADTRLGRPGTAARLLSLGLAHALPHDPPVLSATAPVAAVEAALAHRRHELTTEYDALAQAQREAVRLRRLADLHQRETPAHRLARVLTDSDEIVALSNTIGTVAAEDHLTLDTFRYDLPLTAHTALPPNPASLARGVRHRGIYETAFLSDPVGAEVLHRCVEGGEEVRLLPWLPMKMKVTDRSQALLALTTTGSSVALHLNSPVAVEAMRQYFELLWQRARPFGVAPPRSAGERNRRRREVAELMNQGFKDEAVARRLDLTPRTLRRRISEIMDELGAETRFAAGAEAQRRGWFEADSG
ncbi:hypothetical protein [Kitasatospora sp. NPDC059571]|uniref:hypothetical protein n=1 Tax=Kitasatospora sp. NPDC059571 TaxID=3346871 RepID=UPI0036CDA8F9